MTDDKRYVAGTFYRICDRTGFKVRSYNTQKQWNNLIVRDRSFEMRQPQDFVTGVRDDQTVWDPRPRQVDRFINQDDLAAEFVVYGDYASGPGPSFLIQNNTGPQYDTGLNTDYQNPNGTALMRIYNGTVPAVLPENYPASNGADSGST